MISNNGTNYDYHFIINELANKFKTNGLSCLGENMEKYITIKVPIFKENVDGELFTCKLKFIDSKRLMSASLSNHTDNLSEIYSCKCEDQKNQRIHLKVNNKNLISKCKTCNNKSKIPINTLIKKFPNTYHFCNDNIDKFILSLRKSVYPYDYMDSWERFNEKTLPHKKEFYSPLNLEDITNEDYKHANNA